MSRTRATDATCTECENHIAPHQGPVAPAEFEYLVREIAGALVDVGRGQTYTDAAKRVRARANIGKTSKWRDVINGQTVAEWMADFVPAVAARYEPKEWPAILVLDSTPYRWTEPASGANLLLYTIFAAYGYDIDGTNGRLWKVTASPNGDGPAWAEFLASLPGKPESIVCDQDKAISAGVEMHWGKWSAVNLIHQCEHHLGERAKAAFTSDKLPPEDPVRKLFRGALQTREQWGLFEAEVRMRPKLLMTNSWVARNSTWLRAQTISRPRIPPVYSNGAVEQPLRAFKLALNPRAFTFRNRARLNQLLTLMVLSHRKVDNVTDYSTDIRAYLDAHNGRPHRTYREAYDAMANESGVALLNSLWSVTAQVAMIEARAKRAAPRASRTQAERAP